MGYLFRKTVTRPLPEGAKILRRKGGPVARWKDKNGKIREARATDAGRIVQETGVWYARLRDADGIIREVSTGCRDKSAAAAVLTQLAARVERRKAGILSASEDRATDFAGKPLQEHVDAYIARMESLGLHKTTVFMRRRYLETLFSGCGFNRIADLSRERAETWLRGQTGMSARTYNGYAVGLAAFGNWMVSEGRMVANPFARMRKRNERADPRRPRRALTQEEVARLLDAAERRPLEGKLHAGGGAVQLKPETREMLAFEGYERSLVYRTLAQTGLRWNELRSITIGQAVLDTEPPHLILNAANEKNRKGAVIVLRADLAARLSKYLAARLERRRNDSRRHGGAFPMRLEPDDPLFDMPAKGTREFNKDLVAAKIPKRDDRGMSVDIHSLRHTFSSELARAGVPLATAVALMRHSDPKLTMQRYTHFQRLDLAGALEQLPDFLPKAEGTAHEAAAGENRVALNVALPTVKKAQHESKSGNYACLSTDGDVEYSSTKTPNKYGVFEGLQGKNDGGRWVTRTPDTLRVRQVL
ncbi:MAG TPA: tyrosine-type recombinase/integrase, partial [Candidatus Hydrogenedentes bacterium]|nr:tyrosine-type recombinase/integrase [Candidatus Hydrogenedentota bacterium]HRT22151.1 tyrosine-type recombinase/integrase [Candidatus Hydrogenedentota bacterium]HRT66992.1 tyrosine-type recombinase/integrase [Candidatus Hydrogenedentota bacterium]